MASEYGSWPVEAAAHQMRIERDARRDAISAGMMIVAEMLERYLVAEEERFVGHHRFDDRGHQRIVVAKAERLHEIAEAGQAGLARDRQQPALDQILLLGRQHEARAFLQAAAQIIVIKRRHARAPHK